MITNYFSPAVRTVAHIVDGDEDFSPLNAFNLTPKTPTTPTFLSTINHAQPLFTFENYS